MTHAPLACRDASRRRALLSQTGANSVNGVDAVRVSPKRTQLAVTLLRPWSVKDAHLIAGDRVWSPKDFKDKFGVQFAISGGRRVAGLVVKSIHSVRNSPDGFGQCLLDLNRPTDDSDYTLKLTAPDSDNPPAHFDPVFASATFRFAAVVAPEDCGHDGRFPLAPPAGPPIDYLAKDYASFRRLMLDRMARTVPEWTERRPADLGITLVEALAYAADHLSYYQDAVATEAYLDTARLRTSVRRHARLADYRMHDGCAARAWVSVQVHGDVLAAGLTFFTAPNDPARLIGRPHVSTRDALASAAEGDRVVFEPVPPARPLTLRLSLNEIAIYTWGDAECCLPRGATAATLLPPTPWGSDPENAANWTGPRVGDLLLFEEVFGPRTGQAADADPTHRHVVRLTAVTVATDTPPGKLAAQVVEVGWETADALPFPVCVSVRGHSGVSVARGNIVLVEHGLTLTRPDPFEPHLSAIAGEMDPCQPANDCDAGRLALPRVFGTATFAPPLRGPLTHAAPFPDRATAARSQARWIARWKPDPTRDDFESLAAVPANQSATTGGRPSTEAARPWFAIVGPAATDLTPDPRAAVAALDLYELPPGIAVRDADQDRLTRWHAVSDLLDSGPADRHFVVEVNDVGGADVRFGDGLAGRRPAPDARFLVRYRIGNGLAGNVGAGAISDAIGTNADLIDRLRNPLAAAGGIAPEPTARVKLVAPTAARVILARAITADDYARLAERDDRVQRAAATFLRFPAGTEARVAVDLHAAVPVAEWPLVRREIEQLLNRYRRIGHDVRVVRPFSVALFVRVKVWPKPHADAGAVRAAVRRELVPGTSPSGRRGFFDPDELTFGGRIDASAVIDRVKKAADVAAVQLVSLRRRVGPSEDAAIVGTLAVGPLEIPRLDADLDFPAFGELTIDVEGVR